MAGPARGHGTAAAGAVLEAEAAPGEPVPRAVVLRTGDPALLSAAAALVAGGGSLRCVLQVRVPGGEAGGDPLPPVAGRHALTGSGIRFTPHLPFQAGLRHRARFDPRPLGRPDPAEALTLDFSLPAEPPGGPPSVEAVFPSADELPENLLRLTVCFSRPMRRGHAAAEVSLLGPDGAAVPDALYRAPVELWDRDMRRLTVLLDPGRLKRGVGPNRALGPPLRAGEQYALAIGAGMTDASGARLPGPVLKRFRATAPVREPIATRDWGVVPPGAGTLAPLLLRFPHPLDRTLLPGAITVATLGGDPVRGRVEVGPREREARFTPCAPWADGPHRIAIAPGLEDVCGNRPGAAFDGPPRGHAVAVEATLRFRPR